MGNGLFEPFMLVRMARMVRECACLLVRVFVPLGETRPRLEVFSSFRAREGEFDLPTLKRLQGDREDPESLRDQFCMKCPLMRPEYGAIELPLGPHVPPADVDMGEEESPPPAMDLDLPDMDELFGDDNDQDMEDQGDSTEMALDWLNEHMLSCLFHGPDLRCYVSTPGR